MSSHPVYFRCSVGTIDAHHADVNDEMVERPQQRTSVAFSLAFSVGRPSFRRATTQERTSCDDGARASWTGDADATCHPRHPQVSANRPDVLRSIDMLDRQITQISRLAEDLMDATRIDRGALRVSRATIEVVAVLAGPLTAAALAIAQRGQTLSVQIADRALRIEGDSVRLAQAVSNLLHNAVKYTPEKGCIAVNVLADGKELVVSVKDNGLGICGALLPHIFDLFAQSSRPIATSAGGLGGVLPW